MTDQGISPLRRRMIEDMTMRKLAPRTQQGYIRAIKNLAAFVGRSPDTATFEDIRRFQLHVAASGVGTPTLNHTVSALRFFFRVTLKRPAILEHTAFNHEPRKLPVVLSPEEVARLLDAAPGLKYKTALSVAYGAGLRAAEVMSLKVSDIDSERMLIRVEQGKGRKDRYVMLSPHLLELLRAWYKAARPRGWLFPGAVLAYLARYTHYKVMKLATHEFIRRFLIHVLPDGFHRIRHYGLFASAARADNIARARQLLNAPTPQTQSYDAGATGPNEPPTLSHPCPCCGGRMIIIESFERGSTPRYQPTAPVIRIDTS